MSVNSGGKRPQMQPQQANAGPLQGNNFQRVPLVYHFTDYTEKIDRFFSTAVELSKCQVEFSSKFFAKILLYGKFPKQIQPLSTLIFSCNR